jgi:polyphosphate kinase 2 (PPK2 family)
MLARSGIRMIKFYLSVSREEQARRFVEREINPLKRWKLSPIDKEAQARWDDYTEAKEAAFRKTDIPEAPWIIVKSEDKMRARLETMRYVLQQFDYEGKDPEVAVPPDRLILAAAADVPKFRVD